MMDTRLRLPVSYTQLSSDSASGWEINDNCNNNNNDDDDDDDVESSDAVTAATDMLFLWSLPVSAGHMAAGWLSEDRSNRLWIYTIIPKAIVDCAASMLIIIF